MNHEYVFEDMVMGCEFSVALVTQDEIYAQRAYERMRSEARRYDAQFSRFIKESELSRLNILKEMHVSPTCIEVLRVGRELYEKTEGAFNPLVQIARYGYDADIDEVLLTERGNTESSEPYNTDFSSIRITDRYVYLLPGHMLDVGGYLKGYVAERMTALAPEAYGVIVNLGGDIYTRGRDAQGSAFTFAIEHPHEPNTSISFAYENGAIATSGTYRRVWSRNGVPFHHILDSSGLQNPDSDLISATVLAKRGHDAEAYATAALVLGSKDAGVLLQKNTLEYLCIRHDGTYMVSPLFPEYAVA